MSLVPETQSERVAQQASFTSTASWAHETATPEMASIICSAPEAVPTSMAMAERAAGDFIVVVVV